MEKRTWGALIVGSLAVCVSSLAISQERKPEVQPNKPSIQQERGTLIETSKRVESRSPGFRRSSLIIGSNVNLRGGSRYGKVHEFVISEQGCVDYVIVAYENRFVAVPWSATTYDPGQRVVMLNVEQTQIQTVPTYTEWTEFTSPTYIGKVNTFFKVDVRTRDSDRVRDRDLQRDDDPSETKTETKTKTKTDTKPDGETETKTKTKTETKPDGETEVKTEKKIETKVE